MNPKTLTRQPASWAVAASILLAVSFAFGGNLGLAGMGLGLAGALFGVTALWMVVQLIGRAATSGASPRFGTFLTILTFMAKLPLYWVLFSLSQNIGGAAPTWFLSGVILVYFAVVAWAIAR